VQTKPWKKNSNFYSIIFIIHVQLTSKKNSADEQYTSFVDESQKNVAKFKTMLQKAEEEVTDMSSTIRHLQQGNESLLDEISQLKKEREELKKYVKDVEQLQAIADKYLLESGRYENLKQKYDKLLLQLEESKKKQLSERKEANMGNIPMPVTNDGLKKRKF
jgi:predicted RNase H-like nuclease (RuvC/YqgF family)